MNSRHQVGVEESCAIHAGGVLPNLTAQVPFGAKGDVLQGADPQLQAGSHKKVQPGAKNQMCLWKIDRPQLEEPKNIYHEYNQLPITETKNFTYKSPMKTYHHLDHMFGTEYFVDNIKNFL